MCETKYNKIYIFKILKMKHTNSYIQIEKKKKKESFTTYLYIFLFLILRGENMSNEHFCHR